MSPVGSSCFNPRPPLLAGDAAVAQAMTSSVTSFNPRPPLLAGDAPKRAWSAWPTTSFNPRPPLLAGDAGVRRLQGGEHAVSIRARHCWRAMPCQRWTSSSPSSFQSAPAIAGGRCEETARKAAAKAEFQSAPAIAGGRCFCVPATPAVPPGFNPRPPLLAGDARGVTRSCGCLRRVSIRARHCWRAMRYSARVMRGDKVGFNPRPPLLAGDAEAAQAVAVVGTVSIRARHCWRAMPCSK